MEHLMSTLRTSPWIAAKAANDAQDAAPPSASDLKPDEIAPHAAEYRCAKNEAHVKLPLGGHGAGKNEKKKRRHRKAQLTCKYGQKHSGVG
jgi:hypothetical protein